MDLNLENVVQDLVDCKTDCDFHLNKYGVEWATGLLVSIEHLQNITVKREKCNRYYYRASNLIKLGQYKRAAFYAAKKKDSPIHEYLYYYASYLAIDADRLNMTSESDSQSSSVIKLISDAFNKLLVELEVTLVTENTSSSWLRYIAGLICIKLNKQDQARDHLIKSIHLQPLNWPAWHQLASLVIDKHHLKNLKLPTHWFTLFFYGLVYSRLQMYEDAHELYSSTSLGRYFQESVYVLCEMAKAQNELRDVEAANDTFKKARSIDPYRLDDMDVCSNALYVSQKIYELASLAHVANDIEPFRLETCFCLANFYSLRGQHDKAATYFSRALKLDPTNISAWILMGHEFMEMKSTEDAIKAYRSAIQLDRTDHRAWYGLGQLYEILKLPNISLDNYLEAYKLKPNDSRIVTALKEIYEKLGWTNHARTYHKRAMLQAGLEDDVTMIQ